MFTLLVLLACSPLRPGAEVGEGASGPRPPKIDVRLVAEAKAYAPGEPLWLGVRFDIQQGWHLYWSNPGDTGLPTTATLTLPAGWVEDMSHYTVPHRFVSPGELVSFGYSDEATLLFRVVSPPDAAGPATFTASARWLACKEICVPGEAQVTLTLPQNEGEWVRGGLDAQLAQIGRPLVQWPGATSSYDTQARALTIDLPGAAQVEVYPDSDTWLHLAGPPQVAASDRGQLVRLTLRSDAPVDLTPSAALRVFPKGGGDPLTLSSFVPSLTPE